jgi:chromate reductase
MTRTNLLVFAGSAREASFNKKLARLAAAAANEAGAAATFVDLRDYPLPLMDEDLEAAQGEPTHATALKTLMKQADGFIIASPEHNSAYSALLKNVIDWASRKREGEKPRACFEGKTALLLSASPGQLGGLRGLVVLRMLLGNLGMLVLPDQLAIGAAHQAFDAQGALVDEAKAAMLKKLVAGQVALTAKLKG